MREIVCKMIQLYKYLNNFDRNVSYNLSYLIQENDHIITLCISLIFETILFSK